MSRRQRIIVVACLSCVLPAATPLGPIQPAHVGEAAGVDETQPLPRHLAEETLRWAMVEAGTYEILVGEKSKTKLELYGRSILRWSNPLTGAYGEVFLWTKRGRPLVLASLYQYYLPQRYLAVEFQSLAPEGLTARRGSTMV